jgi:hypothetical protein
MLIPMNVIAENLRRYAIAVHGKKRQNDLLKEKEKPFVEYYAVPFVKYLLFYIMSCCSFPFDNRT